jgi:hypothetical protein
MNEKIILMTICIVFLYGCNTQRNVSSREYYSTAQQRSEDNEDNMDSWIGITKQQLLLKWGAPSSTYSDSAGSEILTYVKANGIPDLFMGGTLRINHTYSFYIDSSGKIYHCKYDRNVQKVN